MRLGLVTGLAILMVASATTAQAQARPDSITMSCQAAQDLVRRQGAVVLGTGPNVFDRYVADRRFCMPTQRVVNAFTATKDNAYCLVGYLCREASRFDASR